MSTTIARIHGTGRNSVDLQITSFYGGKDKGRMLQLTQGFGTLDEPGFIQLTHGDVCILIEYLRLWMQEVDDV